MAVLDFIEEYTVGPSYDLVVVDPTEHGVRLLILIRCGDIEGDHSFIDNFSFLKLEHKVVLLSWKITIWR